MTERYEPGDLIRRLYQFIDQLETVAAKREAHHDRYGDLIGLGYAVGLRYAAKHIRNIIHDAEKEHTDTMTTILFKRLSKTSEVPRKAKPDDAGYDLRYDGEAPVKLTPGSRNLTGTGIAVHIPQGYVGYINPRSGRAHKEGLSVVNAPGTVDSGYTGELFVNLINLDSEAEVTIHPGEKIAQMVVHPIAVLPERVLEDHEELPQTSRGADGHGSTGNK